MAIVNRIFIINFSSSCLLSNNLLQTFLHFMLIEPWNFVESLHFIEWVPPSKNVLQFAEQNKIVLVCH